MVHSERPEALPLEVLEEIDVIGVLVKVRLEEQDAVLRVRFAEGAPDFAYGVLLARRQPCRIRRLAPGPAPRKQISHCGECEAASFDATVFFFFVLAVEASAHGSQPRGGLASPEEVKSVQESEKTK